MRKGDILLFPRGEEIGEKDRDFRRRVDEIVKNLIEHGDDPVYR